MRKAASPHLTSLVFDALLTSFWRKSALQRFLRDCGISASFVGTLGPDESKRMFLERLFAELQQHAKGGPMLLRMAQALADQTDFPDLLGWEDSSQKIDSAKRAVLSLRKYLQSTASDLNSEARRERGAERETELRRKHQLSLQRLNEFKARLGELARRIGSQEAGYEFQDWFYDLMDFFEVISRRPYVVDGRQIDGTITDEGTTYIVELKFTADQSGATDIDSLSSKVNKKADNTMGVMVSMSGYSSVAKSDASGPGTKLLLLDYNHIYMVLDGLDFCDLLRRVRRHASQTSQSYLDHNALR